MNTLVWLDAILFVLPCWRCLMQTKENWWQKFCISLSQLTSLSPSVACLPDSPLRHKLEPCLHSCLLVLLDPLSSPTLGHCLPWHCQRSLLPATGSAPGDGAWWAGALPTTPIISHTNLCLLLAALAQKAYGQESGWEVLHSLCSKNCAIHLSTEEENINTKYLEIKLSSKVSIHGDSF